MKAMTQTDERKFTHASRRDASWFRCPSNYGKASRYHAVDQHGIAACSVWCGYEKDFDSIPLASTPKEQRCRRAACHREFELADLMSVVIQASRA